MEAYIELFTSDIENQARANAFRDVVVNTIAGLAISIDFEDCDHVVRAASNQKIDVNQLYAIAMQEGIELHPMN